MREETLNVQGLQLSYKTAGEGPAVLILHGWGSSSEAWKEFQVDLAQQGYRVIVPDLPGFGLTPPPQSVWGVKEYKNFVVEFVGKLGLQKFFLVGNSFGGQVATQFAVDHTDKIEGLVLLAAAGVRRNLGAKEKILRSLAKPLNILFSFIPSEKVQDAVRVVLYRMVGRSDYARAKGVMREVMRKVVRQDLTALFSSIKVRTLIIWGDRDRMTPIEDAYIMKKYIQNSSLEILPGVGHHLRSEAPERLQELLTKFLKK